MNVMDNKASTAIKAWLANEKVAYQWVPPGCSRANDAERAIHMGKYHLIAGICTTDPSYPITEWDMLVEQGKRSPNILRPTRINPKKSAYAYLKGQYSYNAVPFALLGCEILCFGHPTNRASWSPYGVRGFNVVPCPGPEHYRCNEVLLPVTRSIRVSNMVVFFPPPNCTLPSMPTAEERVQQAVQELGRTLRDIATNNPT